MSSSLKDSSAAEKYQEAYQTPALDQKTEIVVIDLIEKIKSIGFPESLVNSRLQALAQRREARNQYRTVRKSYQPLLTSLITHIADNEGLTSQAACELRKEITRSIYKRTRSAESDSNLQNADDSYKAEVTAYLNSNSASRDAFQSMYEAHILSSCDRRAKRIREGKVDGGRALLLASSDEYLTRLLDRMIRYS